MFVCKNYTLVSDYRGATNVTFSQQNSAETRSQTDLRASIKKHSTGLTGVTPSSEKSQHSCCLSDISIFRSYAASQRIISCCVKEKPPFFKKGFRAILLYLTDQTNVMKVNKRQTWDQLRNGARILGKKCERLDQRIISGCAACRLQIKSLWGFP